ncbi:MAG: urease accessory protein UreD, partial [Acetobacteraceae bacterium]|nr:urease accessory protein UreD [Acetobacteraceae bacterium]
MLPIGAAAWQGFAQTCPRAILQAMPRDATDAVLPSHQRASGRFVLGFAVGRDGRGTVLRHLDQQAPLRVLFPDPEPGDPILGAILNCAGGLAGGDALDQAARLGPGTRVTLSSAAAEKVYRSLGPETRVATRLALGAGAVLEWIPQETILFDAARFCRSTTVELGEAATLLAAETLVFGRAARGERLRRGFVLDRWHLRDAAGALLWADALELGGDIEAALDAPFGFDGAEALGTVLLAAPEAGARLAMLRALPAP